VANVSTTPGCVLVTLATDAAQLAILTARRPMDTDSSPADEIKTLVWRRLDEPGMEVAHVRSLDDATGVQIGRSYELRWWLRNDRLDLELDGERRSTVRLGDADFFDLFASPFFNSLPVMRDGLLESGHARDYVMTFVHVPELTVEASPQRYEPIGHRVVRYSSGDFQSDITFDGDGFVTHYAGFLERII
jgi:hypothetical protein